MATIKCSVCKRNFEGDLWDGTTCHKCLDNERERQYQKERDDRLVDENTRLQEAAIASQEKIEEEKRKHEKEIEEQRRRIEEQRLADERNIINQKAIEKYRLDKKGVLENIHNIIISKKNEEDIDREIKSSIIRNPEYHADIYDLLRENGEPFNSSAVKNFRRYFAYKILGDRYNELEIPSAEFFERTFEHFSKSGSGLKGDFYFQFVLKHILSPSVWNGIVTHKISLLQKEIDAAETGLKLSESRNSKLIETQLQNEKVREEGKRVIEKKLAEFARKKYLKGFGIGIPLFIVFIFLGFEFSGTIGFFIGAAIVGWNLYLADNNEYSIKIKKMNNEGYKIKEQNNIDKKETQKEVDEFKRNLRQLDYSKTSLQNMLV